MTTTECIALFVAIATIIGWFVNSSANRKNEIAKERMKFQLDLLISLLGKLEKIAVTPKNGHGGKRLDDEGMKEFLVAVRLASTFGNEKDLKIYEDISKQFNENHIIVEETMNKLYKRTVERIQLELK